MDRNNFEKYKKLNKIVFHDGEGIAVRNNVTVLGADDLTLHISSDNKENEILFYQRMIRIVVPK
jgi:hypothetical protein